MSRCGAALLALALAIAGCSDDEPETVATTTSVPSTTAAPTTTAPATTVPTTTAPATTVPPPAPTAAALCGLVPAVPEPVVVESPELTEISGLAASRQHPGLVWAHNDSGDSARLHLLDADTGAAIGTWPLEGAGAFDWEDMAISTGPDNSHHLYAADLGDNFRIRRDIRVYRAAEPTDVTTPVALEVDEFIFTYPDGPTDAESLFVDPESGDFIVVSKSWDDSPTTIYRAPGDTSPNTSTELENIGELDLTGLSPLVTAADITADARVIAVRTTEEILLWDRPPGVDIGATMAGPPCLAPSVPERQGEALTFLADGSGYLTISEGANPPIHWFVID